MPRDHEPNYHNKAQEDYWNNNFDPPRDTLSAPFWSDQDVKDWEDYKAAWDNAKSQDDD